MTKQWPKVKLGTVLQPVKRSESVDPAKTYRLLGIRLDGNGPFVRESVSGAQTAASKLNRVEAGDFIYSRLFACRGAFGLIEHDLHDCYVSGEFPTFRAVESEIDLRFLRFWFRLPSVIRKVDEDCTGSTPLTRNRYKENFFLDLEISLPPLDEQQRIVAYLDALSAKITQARTLRQHAIEEAAALLLNEIGAVFARLEAKHGRRTFESFSPHVTSGPRNWAKHYEQSGPRFYRAQDIGPHGNVLNDSKVFIAPPTGGQGRTATLHHGDLMLVITGATVGRATVFREGLEPGFVSQHVGICRLPQCDVEPEFALWGLRGPMGQAQLLGQRYGQGKPGLNLTNIRAVSLPFPTLPEQRRVVAELDALQAKVDALEHAQAETAAELEALQSAALDRAFKGEL